jgi:hypothetical protein
MVRFLCAVTVAVALLACVPAVSLEAQATCSYPILSLGQEVGRAPLIVVADVARERPDGSGGFFSTLRIRGVLKGRPPGPDVTLYNLGHPSGACDGGPRLPRGGRYMLFLNGDPTDPNSVWGLVDVDGGVYQIAADGVRTPPEHPGGQPGRLPVAQAEFIRDVGTLAGTDAARVEGVISSLGLAETVEQAAPAPSEQKSIFDRLPRRETSLAIAAGAVLIASLTFLLWRPADAHPSR